MSKVKGTGIPRPYKVRKSWEDTKTQGPSYSNIHNAMMKLLELNKSIKSDNINDYYKLYRDGNLIFKPDIKSTSNTNNDKRCDIISINDKYTDAGFSNSINIKTSNNGNIALVSCPSKNWFRRLLDKIFHRKDSD